MASNIFGSIGNDIVARIFSGILWFGIAVLIIGVVGLIMWYYLYYRKKFDIKVLIKSDRAGKKFKIIEDKGAILYNNKDKNKFLRLAGLKIDLPVPPYQILQSTNKGDMIEIWRKSEDEFIYLTPGTINKEFVIMQDGKRFPIAQIEQKQIEGDIAYWNVKRKEKHKSLFDTENWLMKILPFLPQIIGGMITIFVLYILMDSLPSILSQLTELTKELKEMKTATIVSQGLILLTWKQITYKH